LPEWGEAVIVWMAENYIFHTLAVVVFLNWDKIKRYFAIRRLKRVKAGPVDLEFENVNSDLANIPCPYTKSRNDAFSFTRGEMKRIEEKVDSNSIKIDDTAKISENLNNNIKDIKIDLHKYMFYVKTLPEQEVMIHGLKYIFAGGNGDVKPDVEVYAREHPKIYKTVISLQPNLAIKNFCL